MSLDEEIANSFRISLTEQKLRNEKIDNEYDANSAHYNVGKEVRNTIAKVGGIMPEDMLTIDLMDAYTSLGAVIGEDVDEDLIDNIFSRFCLGK